MRRVLFRVLAALLMLTGGLFIVLVGTLLYGHVSGEEFAPYTFERRVYSYFELPVVRIQVTPVRRTVSRPQLEQTLVDRKYITINSPPRRWDYVISHRLGEKWREGDAHILSQYLDAWRGESESHWLHWTNTHPAIAKIFWSEIAKLARQDLYLFTPELFELASEQTEPQPFQGDLNRVLARKYEELAQVETELKNFATAVQFFTEALSYEPTREASLRGRARAGEALGRSAQGATGSPALVLWRCRRSGRVTLAASKMERSVARSTPVNIRTAHCIATTTL